jgi:hypothetical protein
VLGLPARASRPDEFLIDCAERRPSCAAEWAVPTPAAFATRFSTTAGTFTVEVNTSWAPPMAARFHLLSRIGYFDGSPFYRVLDRNATTRFVSQWGYRGGRRCLAQAADIEPDLARRASGQPPRLRRLRHGLGRGAAAAELHGADVQLGLVGRAVRRRALSRRRSARLPDDGGPLCSRARFVNLANNSRLDPMGFAPFGTIAAAEMVSVVGGGHSFF